ncbi:unnamed protein product [Closterium sp. NIES-54]
MPHLPAHLSISSYASPACPPFNLFICLTCLPSFHRHVPRAASAAICPTPLPAALPPSSELSLTSPPPRTAILHPAHSAAPPFSSRISIPSPPHPPHAPPPPASHPPAPAPGVPLSPSSPSSSLSSSSSSPSPPSSTSAWYSLLSLPPSPTNTSRPTLLRPHTCLPSAAPTSMLPAPSLSRPPSSPSAVPCPLPLLPLPNSATPPSSPIPPTLPLSPCNKPALSPATATLCLLTRRLLHLEASKLRPSPAGPSTQATGAQRAANTAAASPAAPVPLPSPASAASPLPALPPPPSLHPSPRPSPSPCGAFHSPPPRPNSSPLPSAPSPRLRASARVDSDLRLPTAPLRLAFGGPMLPALLPAPLPLVTPLTPLPSLLPLQRTHISPPTAPPMPVSPASPDSPASRLSSAAEQRHAFPCACSVCAARTSSQLLAPRPPAPPSSVSSVQYAPSAPFPSPRPASSRSSTDLSAAAALKFPRAGPATPSACPNGLHAPRRSRHDASLRCARRRADARPR